MKSAWENIDDHTDRLKVPNGWIVRSYMKNSWGNTLHQIFVEDKEHGWVLPVPSSD